MGHDVILFADPQTGLPFKREFGNKQSVVEIAPSGRLIVGDPSLAIEACAAGFGLFRSLAMGLGSWLESRRLVPVLEGWSNETFPLFAFHPSRHLVPAKVRVCLDFLLHVASTWGERVGGEVGRRPDQPFLE